MNQTFASFNNKMMALNKPHNKLCFHPHALVLLLALCAWTTAAQSSATRSQDKPQATRQQAASPVITQAQNLLSAGKTDAAIETLTAANRFNPNDAQVNHLLGLAYYQKSDYARAIEHLTISLRQTPASSPQYRQSVKALGLSHYVLGHLKDALPYLEQLNGWSPGSTEITYALGISYVQTRNTDKARETFARMFKVPASSASAYLINAQMMVRQQFEELAESELQKALELDPRLPQANFLLGEMAIYHANLERGIELLQKEIAFNPAFGMAYYRLGEAYTRQLKWDEAIEPLQKSIWLNPYFSGPYIVLGKVYLKKADIPNAENMLRHALQMDPNNFSGHHLLAQVLQQSNRAEEARKEFAIAEQLRTSADKDQ